MRRMWWGLGLLAVVWPGLAMAQEFEQGLATLWEVLWHQSGAPTRIVRWENDIRFRMTGVNLAANRERMLEALRTVTAEAGVTLVDVSNEPGAPANLNIEFTADNSLEDNQPCVTVLDFKTETRIDSATIQMRSRDARRCAYHEAMHLMGVRGHPAGKTVLSYFPGAVDGLQPLDRTMLRAWYSHRMASGMTPLEALPVLADELLATAPDKLVARRTRDSFIATTFQQMLAFANGQGDIPIVVKRSGKATEEGTRYGRAETSYFLSLAYLDGTTVPRDTQLAMRWLERAAVQGNRPAQASLGAVR